MPDHKKVRAASKEKRLFRRKIRYRGRVQQIAIILGKFMRMFIYQNDWKVFPISALIAGLLAYVIRTDFMRTMEGTLKGSFAITCVALWNGCFNSVQVICREREIVKREHRVGMHISSYIFAHMIFQAMLCMGQTALTLYVFHVVGIRFSSEGVITPWLRVDLGITIFLITFAADMLALLISSIVRSTTSAMTVMPFLLIFQLVFSGGIFSLPAWTRPLTQVTLSNHGLTCICAQADYNSLPMAAAWNALKSMRDTEIGGTFRVEDLLEFVDEQKADRSELIRDLRQMDVVDIVVSDEEREKMNSEGRTLPRITMGEVLDKMEQDPDLEAFRSREFTGSVTIGQIIDIFGEKEVKDSVAARSALAGRKGTYENTSENILGCWFTLLFYAMMYVALAIISLEFVDKDKR